MKNNDLFLPGKPVYMQLYEKLRKDITDGVYHCGERFLSKRLIAQRWNVSLITAQHSLELLQQEGYLEARERSGYFVAFRERDLFSPAPVMRQAVGIPVKSADFPFSVYAKIMRRVITQQGENLLQRVPGTGLPQLKDAISRYLARSRGIRVEPERIVIGSGSEYLYGLIVQLFGRRTSYAIENPSYNKIEMVYRANGAEPEGLPLGSDGIRSEALNACRARVLHITPYRSFPSGISTSAGKRREYIHWANSNGAWIVQDDYESEFSPSSKPQETVFSLANNDNVLYLNSFSRTIAPSLRIAYLLLPRTLTGQFEDKLGFYACSVPGFDQYVLAEFINSGEFERHLNRTRRKLRNASRAQVREP